MFKRIEAIGLLFTLCITASLHAQTQVVQDAQQKLDAGQYQEAIRIVSQALTRSRPNDDSPERYQLLMIKGEALMRIGQNASAANTFDMAFKSAPDTKAAALARANALLIRASSGGKYMPKSGVGAKPIEIQDPATRKDAYLALRDDLVKSTKMKYDAALRGNSLPPMIDLLPSLLDQAYLEYAANGSIESSRGDLTAMGQHARDLMTAELRRLRHQIDVLEDVSNSQQDYTRRGLFSQEKQALDQDVIPYLSRIEKTARDARARARSLGMDGAAWEPIIADAQDQIDRAQAMLNAGP